MAQHKWHKEIKAWADGAEIEARTTNTDGTLTEWHFMKNPHWESSVEYRIKPQPKEPQYLYVYQDLEWSDRTYKLCRRKASGYGQYVGKIKLEE